MKQHKAFAWLTVIFFALTMFTGMKKKYQEVFIMNFKKLGLFAAGTLFGTAGIKVLTSKDARKVYTEVTAAALRAKECVMTTVTNVQEGAGDILADAKVINDQRAAAAEAEVVEDAAEASAETAE